MLDWLLPEFGAEAVPDVDWETLSRLQPFVSALVSGRRLRGSRAVGRGGLLRTLLSFVAPHRDMGVYLRLPALENPLGFFFSEAPGRIVLAYFPEEEKAVREAAREFGLPILLLGQTALHRFSVHYRDRENKDKEIRLPLSSIAQKYLTALTGQMETLP